MQGETFLGATAQVGATLAGFAGVISTFRPQGTQWPARELAGVKLILEFSLAAVLFALLPFIFHAWFAVEVETWRYSCYFLGVFFVVEVCVQLKRVLDLAPRTPPKSPWRLSALLLLTFALMVLIWTAANSSYAFHLYSLGLLWLLFAPAAQFLHFLHFLRDDSP